MPDPCWPYHCRKNNNIIMAEQSGRNVGVLRLRMLGGLACSGVRGEGTEGSVWRLWAAAEEPYFLRQHGFSLPSLGESRLGGTYNYPCICHFGKRTCVHNHWKEISWRGKSMSWLAQWGLAAAAKTLCEGGGLAGIPEALLVSGCDRKNHTFLCIMNQNDALMHWELLYASPIRALYFYFNNINFTWDFIVVKYFYSISHFTHITS